MTRGYSNHDVHHCNQHNTQHVTLRTSPTQISCTTEFERNQATWSRAHCRRVSPTRMPRRVSKSGSVRISWGSLMMFHAKMVVSSCVGQEREYYCGVHYAPPTQWHAYPIDTSIDGILTVEDGTHPCTISSLCGGQRWQGTWLETCNMSASVHAYHCFWSPVKVVGGIVGVFPKQALDVPLLATVLEIVSDVCCTQQHHNIHASYPKSGLWRCGSVVWAYTTMQAHTTHHIVPVVAKRKHHAQALCVSSVRFRRLTCTKYINRNYSTMHPKRCNNLLQIKVYLQSCLMKHLVQLHHVFFNTRDDPIVADLCVCSVHTHTHIHAAPPKCSIPGMDTCRR